MTIIVPCDTENESSFQLYTSKDQTLMFSFLLVRRFLRAADCCLLMKENEVQILSTLTIRIICIIAW